MTTSIEYLGKLMKLDILQMTGCNSINEASLGFARVGAEFLWNFPLLLIMFFYGYINVNLDFFPRPEI